MPPRRARRASVRRLAAVLALAAGTSACSSDDEPERGLDAIEAPGRPAGNGTTTQPAPGEAPGGTGGSTPGPAGAGTGETTTTASSPGGQGPAVPPRQVVSFDDPVGDAVGGPGGSAPGWSDLAGATLERQGNAYRLAVRLGDRVPTTQPGEETMNVATFFDTDGDGQVDHELWVNLGPDGWGPVFYEGDAARPGEASNVTVTVEGPDLRMLFPEVMLGAPGRLQFSVASEYGTLDVIGSEGARRDDAPDDDEAVAFP